MTNPMLPLLLSLALAGACVGTATAATPRTPLDAALPAWTKAAGAPRSLDASRRLSHLGIVLRRSEERQRAFDAHLAALQDPSSPLHGQWLEPREIGERFGADAVEIAAVSAWLESEGLEPESVTPTRRILRFGGRVEDVERAFATRLAEYDVGGRKRIAPRSAPSLPDSIAARVEHVVGLETLRLHARAAPPLRRDSAVLEARAKASLCGAEGCEHYIFPGDFAVLYGLEGARAQGHDGSGQSIAVVARTRVHAPDIAEFRSRAALPAMTFDTVIAEDGSDPGPPADHCGGVDEPGCDDRDDVAMDQFEATMDVSLAAGAAPGARIKLVTSGETDGVDGVILAIEHAVWAEPLPARIVSISWGTCEADNSAGAAAYVNEMFADAAMRGISVFASSGDAGAGDCTPHHQPPDGDRRHSVNLLCSSPHVTCVGGTELADEPADAYWSATNGPGFTSALGRIPERGWNHPVNREGAAQVAASGGGVSARFATPDWQVGAGVPLERAGRYVPDVALNASTHTGYFLCMAAFDGSCVSGEDGAFRFMIGGGTSASAPSMAGIAAMLNQRAGAPQGNLNPRLYAIAGNPLTRALRDVAPGAGEACDLDVPSSCNNSTPGADGGPALRGHALGHGHDRVTGLGSPDATRLLEAWMDPAAAGTRLNQRGIGGSWANPATDSQGLVVDVSPDFFNAQTGNLFAGWFTFADDGSQRWYTLQGPVGDVAGAHLPIYETTGGRFDHPQATTTRTVGDAWLVLEGCGRARLDYRFDQGARSGTIPLQRLLANVDCADTQPPPSTPADARYAGTWADFGTGGQGLVLDVAPSQALLFGAWYTFAASSVAGADGQRWVTLQAAFPAGARALEDIGIFESRGGVFDGPADTETVQVGTADLSFTSCTTARLDYRYTSGAFAGRTGRLDLTRVTPAPAGCQ